MKFTKELTDKKTNYSAATNKTVIPLRLPVFFIYYMVVRRAFYTLLVIAVWNRGRQR